MRRDATWRIGAALIGLAAWPGCGRSEGPAAPTTAGEAPSRATAPAPDAEPRQEVSTYRLVGEVRGVDREGGEAMIRHEAIPGFMPAMTMPFEVTDRALLEELRVGDRVEGTLRVERSGGTPARSELTDLVVTQPALAPGLSLSVADGKAELKARPAVLEPGQEVPDFAMTTQSGEVLKLSDLRGKVVALTFIYTRCPLPEFCPAMDRRFRAMAERLEAVPGRADVVRLLSVSFDPEHDTPEALRRHAQLVGARPPLWRFAVASHDELARVAPALGLTYGPTGEEIAHSLSTAVIDPSGRLVRLEAGSSGRSWEPEDLLKTINSLIPSSPK